MFASLPPATRRAIQTAVPTSPNPTGAASHRSDHSSDYFTVNSSWESNEGFSLPVFGPDRPPLAWTGVRHKVEDEETASSDKDTGTVGHCSQAVLITCLHLAHETASRDVGMYAWTMPMIKDPAGSTMRIMKQYSRQLKAMSVSAELDVRSAPDPSKPVIQHHLQRARLAAGADNYIAIFYNGHGIQEPPTEAGELWCYDKSFEECAERGGGPCEYIPFLLFDFMSWAGSSTCYVWDCQNAGRFIRAALAEAGEIDSQLRAAGEKDPAVAVLHPAVYAKRQIHFAACGANESIPHITGLPDDLFTSCLTTPLRVALLYHNYQTFPIMSSHARSFAQRSQNHMLAMWHNMSPALISRLWRELQAIVNTIAWQKLRSEEYQFLFTSSGEFISNLACGFLLAQRVMNTYRATPESIPSIPSTASHALWTTWDLIMDSFFEQLPSWFDELEVDTSWEKDLELVSFISDQLEGLTSPTHHMSPGRGPSDASSALSRMPIICLATMNPEYRKQACVALDLTLRHVSPRSLAQAIQGGALSVACQLLGLEVEDLGESLISIWASLVRLEGSVGYLVKHSKSVACLTSASQLKFFLDCLERRLVAESSDLFGTDTQTREMEDDTIIIKIAVILATIAPHVSDDQAGVFTTRSLQLVSLMLERHRQLVKQWGGMLLGEILDASAGLQASRAGDGVRAPVDTESLVMLETQLLALIESHNVETRAAAVYGLSRRIPLATISDIVELQEAATLATSLLPLARTDGSPLVRKEVVGVFRRLLANAGIWTTLILVIYSLQLALYANAKYRPAFRQLMDEIGRSIDLKSQQRELMFTLTNILEVFTVLQHDPDARVVNVTYSLLKGMMDELQPFLAKDEWEGVFEATFPPSLVTPKWTDELVAALTRVAKELICDWKKRLGKDTSLKKGAVNHDLFETSRLALQEHIERQAPKTKAARSPSTMVVSDPNPHTVSDPTEMTRTLRYRLMEDSMLLAEQQVGIPWKWDLKTMTGLDGWRSLNFHSFDDVLLACNDTHSVLLYDNNTSKQTGAVRLVLPRGSRVKSARFVNELFPNNVILAEISNGDIHVISGSTHAVSRMKSISSFLGLDITRSKLSASPDALDRGKLATTWWRQAGRLVVGGEAEIVNVWDCPAERCLRNFATGSTVAVTDISHEPISGNILFAGFGDGIVKLFDLRQSRRTSLMSYDTASDRKNASENKVLRVGMKLGESRYITTACTNGSINIHDLRFLKDPVDTTLVHPEGMRSASFQAFSGIMSTVSDTSWETAREPTSNLRENDNIAQGLDVLSLAEPKGCTNGPTLLQAGVDMSLYRSSGSFLSAITSDRVVFPEGMTEAEGTSERKSSRAFTALHPLRPVVGVGNGASCVFRGCGVGQGNGVDSGSSNFLKEQRQYAGEGDIESPERESQ